MKPLRMHLGEGRPTHAHAARTACGKVEHPDRVGSDISVVTCKRCQSRHRAEERAAERERERAARVLEEAALACMGEPARGQAPGFDKLTAYRLRGEVMKALRQALDGQAQESYTFTASDTRYVVAGTVPGLLHMLRSLGGRKAS